MMNAETEQFIDEYDKANGKEWSNRKEGIGEFAEAFANKHLQEVKSIIEKGTINRRHYKMWELQVLRMCDEFGAE